MSAPANKTKRIGKNFFRLTGRDSQYFKGQHIVNFTPQPKNKLLKSRSIIPTFNHDGKYYTYAFQLPSSHLSDEAKLMEEHDKRAAEALIQHSQILMPKPRSRHKYCGVCRGHYEDYKDHIESELHLTHLKNSRYQEMIAQMCIRLRKNTDKMERKDQEEVNVIDLTAEEANIKAAPELIETNSSSKGVLS